MEEQYRKLSDKLYAAFDDVFQFYNENKRFFNASLLNVIPKDAYDIQMYGPSYTNPYPTAFCKQKTAPNSRGERISKTLIYNWDTKKGKFILAS